MKYGAVYVVVSDGELEYASADAKAAAVYATNRTLSAAAAILEEWGNDDPSPEDYAQAAFQAGFDGESHTVMEVDISGHAKNDMVELPDGIEVKVADILAKLSRSSG